MRTLVKNTLHQLSCIPGLGKIWLRAMRWMLKHFAVPISWRDSLMWPLATHILGPEFNRTIQLKTGITMQVGMDDQISRLILFYPDWHDYLWEPQTLRLALKLQPAGSQTLIAGAHIGYHVLHLAQPLATQSGQVYALEPVGQVYRLLNQNRQLSGLEQTITTRQLALAASSQTHIQLQLAGMRSSITSTRPDDLAVEQVDAITLDDYITRYQIPRIDLLFLDIEGSELDVLSAAPQLLSTGPDMILEVNRPGLHQLGHTPDDLYRLLHDHSYTLFYIHDDYYFTLRGYDPQTIVLQPLINEDPTFRPHAKHFNILATRQPGKLDQPGIQILAQHPIQKKETP